MTAPRGLTEQDGLGLLDGLSEPAHGQVVQPPVELFGRVQEVHQERGLERATEGLMNEEENVSHRIKISKYELKKIERRSRRQVTDGQRELKRIPSRAWIMASSRVMARTAPLLVVSTSVIIVINTRQIGRNGIEN